VGLLHLQAAVELHVMLIVSHSHRGYCSWYRRNRDVTSPVQVIETSPCHELRK